MSMQQFTAVIERDDDWYVALCPELDIASQGKSVEEARRNLIEAIELFFEVASPSEIRERTHSPSSTLEFLAPSNTPHKRLRSHDSSSTLTGKQLRVYHTVDSFASEIVTRERYDQGRTTPNGD